MPIKNLTKRLPMIGKLRKGKKHPEKGYPMELDYFRFTSDNPEVEKAFLDVYGAEPKRLRVYLPYDNPDANFPYWMDEWSKTRLLHRCDGQTCVSWWDVENEVQVTDYEQAIGKPCPYVDTPYSDRDTKKTCKPSGTLYVLLPDMMEVGHVGLVALHTGSWDDISNITGALDFAYNGMGDLSKIPFVLYRTEVETTTKKARRKHYMVRIKPEAEFVRERITFDQPQLASGDDGGSFEEAEVTTIDAPNITIDAPKAYTLKDVKKLWKANFGSLTWSYAQKLAGAITEKRTGDHKQWVSADIDAICEIINSDIDMCLLHITGIGNIHEMIEYAKNHIIEQELIVDSVTFNTMVATHDWSADDAIISLCEKLGTSG